jgi:Putative MetA-pathway of phenol degradation
LKRFGGFFVACLLLESAPAFAGPPYITDDPEPTDYQHFEIYTFADGTSTHDGRDGETGIDFNYGGAEDLQLTAVVPLAYEPPRGQGTVAGVGNIELAAKYRFLREEDFGWDVSAFPRLFLPSLSTKVGDRHASFLLPLWAEKDFGNWATFGGGGCALNNGDGAKNYCLAGWTITRKVLPDLAVGAEIYHQTADTRGGDATTGLGLGIVYDVSENYHLMVSYGPGIQNAPQTDRYAWYAAVLTTF